MHKFSAGSTVKLVSSMGPRGAYKVVRRLPPSWRGIPQYVIRHASEEHDRIAAEDVLDLIEEKVG
jgi:hypothetical protein